MSSSADVLCERTCEDFSMTVIRGSRFYSVALVTTREPSALRHLINKYVIVAMIKRTYTTSLKTRGDVVA
jgi:hypothetical protein